ncbi:hypothetical protein D9757_011470 [Collybiopsis confluens]|uniref:XPG-I domain-containing protein n=1 Tax=Collybiopsis confluens TaxID=2823264 RepID=A0A8H5GJX5_9AGAR|nr:hypothetical protein D9757_015015 [Collybiopsis confluens]KAF5366363.1 hypothetical protein D9757_011470 [Collybiopsis confluens]
MGVAGLWPLLEAAQSITTLTALSLTKFDAPSRGYRIGIDASIWFFHAEYGKEGENPELRTLFFRCAQLLAQGFLPLFVFDGPLRPDIKRNKRINKSAHKLVTGMQAIIEAFGFEYRTAPGEAEAELAFLNRIGVIDGILSDDVDNFLFGANTVIRNHSSTHAGAKSVIEKSKVFTYTLPHPSLPTIGREDLIFIALCSGSDYGTGLDNCGVKISWGLARAGFGKSLCKAATNHPEDSPELAAFLHQWKSRLAQELMTNASGFLPRKSPKLAKSIPDSFPDTKVLRAYLIPVTSESLGRSERYNDLLVDEGKQDGWLRKDPSLAMLAEKCEFYFEWGFMESIIKRFRTVIFHGVTLRILRRAVVLGSSRDHPDEIPLATIRSYFCSGNYSVEAGDPPFPAFIKDISKTRTHESTSKALEYRVCVDPSILVQLTSKGVKGVRRPDDRDEWAEFETGSADDDASSDEEWRKKGKPKEFPDPTLPLKLWLPAVLVRAALPEVVEAYEEVVRRKEEKKAGKGKRAKAKATGQPSTTTSPRKPKLKITTSAREETSNSIAPKANLRPKTAILTQPHTHSSDEDLDYGVRLFNRPQALSVSSSSTAKAPSSTHSALQPSSSISAASFTKHDDNIKSFFNVSKPSTRGKGKQKATEKSDSILSVIDDISTPKKKNRRPAQDETSPTKGPPQPFPLSTQDSLDESSETDDPFSHPQTPSPKNSSRKASAISSSDSSEAEDESNTPKDKERILNKSPRKSKEHAYAQAFNAPEEGRKTIRDIQHPSRLARAGSPTPTRRSPAKAASAPLGTAKTRPTQVSKLPVVIISDSEDDKVPALPKPTTLFVATKNVVKMKPRLKPSVKPKDKRPDADEDPRAIPTLFHFKAANVHDDDDVPPLLRARARAKAKEATSQQQALSKPKMTMKEVDVIELSE